ncbi:Hypothetical predicted protein [Cloeon dipterum]|uniref:Diuretic hormone receptor n=1 Tax=Cloeon dipterum TaxID=197152 RepID=A0A8S1CV72_9INSE|nr:Hypothetical predicted protein [Cloeon dipterum]
MSSGDAADTSDQQAELGSGLSPEDLEALKNHPELLCLQEGLLQEPLFEASLFCRSSWDTVLCWPNTAAGHLASQPCFEELNGVKYDTSQNATKLCQVDGTWANYSNYTLCRDLSTPPPIEASVEVTTSIYYAGYTLSLAALGAAVAIFLYFKDLRCLRNTIHTNLMLSYILADFMWILTITMQMSLQSEPASCVALVILLHYCQLTNFFWMFVEGLYLHVLVVETFTVENIRLRVYVCIGWGTPMLIVLIWALVKTFATTSPSDLQGGAAGPMVDIVQHCPWMAPHNYDWIYQGPAVAVLCVNVIFLSMIMWVLITKLRSANSVETQQYRKATKALVVLIPLLGVTYILMIAGPSEGLSAAIYAYVRAIMLSTQGFTVSLFYCFLNTEVQNTLRHHWQRWQTARSINGTGAARSLYHQPTSGRGSRYHKRESCASDVTMTTFVCNLNNGQPGQLRVSPGTATNGSNPASSNALLVRTSPRTVVQLTVKNTQGQRLE